MENSKILNNTQIICNAGSAPAILKVTSQTNSKIEGCLIATENDYKPIENIKPFGTCSLKNGNLCTPATSSPWTKCSFITVENKRKLTINSTCNCSTGGKISIVSVLQNFVK